MLIVILLLFIILAFCIWSLGTDILPFQSCRVVSAFYDKDAFILLRNKDSYYLPYYDISNHLSESDEKIEGIYCTIVKAHKVEIIKNSNIKNAYFRRMLWKYKVYLPENTKTYFKDIAIDKYNEKKSQNEDCKKTIKKQSQKCSIICRQKTYDTLKKKKRVR